MSYSDLILVGVTVLSFMFGVWQYLRSERIKALNNRTLLQIWGEAKRLLKLFQRSKTTEHNKAFEEVARTIENQLLKAIFDTYRPSDTKIDKWALEGKITLDEARRLKCFNV